MENGEKAGRERIAVFYLLLVYLRRTHRDDYVCDNHLLRLCNLFTHPDINFFGFNVFTSYRNCTRISLRCNLEETNSALRF